MNQPQIDIRLALTPADFETAKQLILAYVTWLGIDLSFQNFDAEMDQLPTIYAAPAGGLLLAMVNGEPAGVAGIKPFTGTACELKRMFVGTGFRNLGIGKQLLTEAIALAKNLKYDVIKLDTADFMKAAIGQPL
ncbi:MAG: GNAT family N-acetyltransferase [Spirosoma sp.]|nr:GNAT family N-acetyltransferase [Spirosoma sp.]